MNTKSSEISSGLVAVAWIVTNGVSDQLVRLSDAEAIISAKDAEIEMLNSRAQYGDCDECGTHYSFDPTDGGTICVKCQKDTIAQKDAEIERLKAMLPDIPKAERECKTLEDWRFRALYFESEYAACSHGFNSHASKQSAALKLARQALSTVADKPKSFEGQRMAVQALAAIDALKGE